MQQTIVDRNHLLGVLKDALKARNIEVEVVPPRLAPEGLVLAQRTHQDKTLHTYLWVSPELIGLPIPGILERLRELLALTEV